MGLGVRDLRLRGFKGLGFGGFGFRVWGSGGFEGLEDTRKFGLELGILCGLDPGLWE